MAATEATSAPNTPADVEALRNECEELRARVAQLERRVLQGEERRKAMIHIMDDLKTTNRRLSDQRRAMLHILADYEQDRRRLAQQTERLDNSRRALLHILQDAHRSNQRLEDSRKAMIHIMGDLRETTEEMQRREQELRDKQEQLVQAGKLATLGELTTGVAHELNNPLNNIALYLGNMADQLAIGVIDREGFLSDIAKTQRQVTKATEIISHLRTFGRAAALSTERVALNDVVVNALALVQEQLRLRQIDVELELSDPSPMVEGNPIQLEQIVVNLLTNARDAVELVANPRVRVVTARNGESAVVQVEDSGAGIPAGLEQRIFDPFFTTKEVGQGTGLGLSIIYGIIKEHHGEVAVGNVPGSGARFTVTFPLLPQEERVA